MAANMCIQQNCTDSTGFLYEMITQEMWIPWQTTVEYFDYTWLFSLLGSTMIGLTGIFPLLVIPIEEGADIKTGDSSGTLKILLSFAVGGLLGDIFLHLLPEAWKTGSLNKGNENAKRESLKTRLLYLNNADGKNRERQRAGNKLLSTGSSSLFAISWHRMATEALRDSLEYESHMITDELTAIST